MRIYAENVVRTRSALAFRKKIKKHECDKVARCGEGWGEWSDISLETKAPIVMYNHHSGEESARYRGSRVELGRLYLFLSPF